MIVSIDNRKFDVSSGITVDKALASNRIELVQGTILAVKKRVAVEAVTTDLFSVVTTKGKLIMRIECEKIADAWKRHFKLFEGTSLKWATRDATVFGQIVTDLEPSDEHFEMKKDEVALSLSGFSNESTHIVFGKKTHIGNYSPPKGCGIIGRVVYGRHLIDKMKMGDKILKVDPIIQMKEASKSILKIDSSYVLQEGDAIITGLEIELDGASPVSSEHVYNVLEDGWIQVGFKTSKFISDSRISVASLIPEKLEARRRGTLTVRNTGSNAGGVYTYTSEAPLNSNHSIAGVVKSGMELADVAVQGDRIATYVTPKRMDLLGKSQREVEEVLEDQGVKVERQGDQSDAATVVELLPSSYLEILTKKEAAVKAVEQGKIVKVRLYHKEAPVSVKYFKVVTGLELRRFGKLKAYFSTPKMELILFKGNESISKGLLPENTPTASVSASQIGVTNTVKKFTGMVGIRFTSSNKFGPTAEGFDGTNLVGEVVHNIEALKGLKEGAEIYVTEANR